MKKADYYAKPCVKAYYAQASDGSVEITTVTTRRRTQTTKGTRQVTTNDGGTMQGEILFFIDEKGYGFLSRDDGGPDVFYHRTRLCGIDFPEKGQRVEFGLEKNPRTGKLIAVDVRPLD
jgi:CspA family cold shock protein